MHYKFFHIYSWDIQVIFYIPPLIKIQTISSFAVFKYFTKVNKHFAAPENAYLNTTIVYC